MTAPLEPHTDGGRHVLVATIDKCPDCPTDGLCDDCGDDPQLDYAIECPGVTPACALWLECSTCYVPRVGLAAERREELEQTGEAHGVEHQWIDGRWMTPTTDCYLAGHDALGEEGGYIAQGKPGRWPVEHEVGDGTELYLHTIEVPA